MQKAVNKAQNWGIKHGITFEPEKTEALIITNKTKTPVFLRIRMGNHEILYYLNRLNT